MDFQLGSFSVTDLVYSGFDSALGVFREISVQEKNIAESMMKKMGILHLADRSFQTLSSGEQMRVLICRALVMRPELLILDEPCVFLDPAGREELLKTVESLAKSDPDITILFITQRISDITPLFSNGLLLSDGCIFARGCADELLTGEKLSKLFKVDMQLIEGKNGRKWSVCR
jgi:iron complex transport system ATP-binding protein